MQHLVVIVSSYDRHWHYFPIIARQGEDRLFMFVDHRNTVEERQARLAEHVNIADITSMDVIYASPIPMCAEGAHPWEPINDSEGTMVAVRCPRCGRTDTLIEPFPAKIGTIQRLLAPTA